MVSSQIIKLPVLWALIHLQTIISMFHRQWFLEVFLSPCSDFHDRIVPVFNAVFYKKSTDSLNLFVTSCTADDEIFKVFIIFCWGTLLWKCSTISRFGGCFFFRFSFAHIYIRETPHMLFILNYVTSFFTNKLISSKMFFCFFWVPIPFPAFLRPVAAVKLKTIKIFLKRYIFYVFYVLLWNLDSRFTNDCNLLLFTFYTSSKYFCNWGCRFFHSRAYTVKMLKYTWPQIQINICESPQFWLWA